MLGLFVLKANAQNTQINSIATKYRNWLLGTGADYNNAQVMSRYNSFISAGRNAMDLSDFNFNDPGPEWNFHDSKEAERVYSKMTEQKLIRLVFLYQLKGPLKSPNPNYHRASLRDSILSVFRYLKAKGMTGKSDFEIYTDSAKESVDIYNSIALRSSAYATAIFLMKDDLKAAGQFDHHMAILQALTFFMSPDYPGYRFTHPGLNTDVIRASTQQRLCYILAQDDTSNSREANMNQLKKMLNNSLRISNGWGDCIKPDFVTYHHRGVYSNTYGVNALHQMSILNMILNGSSYELDETGQSNLKEAAMAYTKFCKDFEMPRAIGGRFPFNTDVLDDLRPAYAYLYVADPAKNKDCGREFVRLWGVSKSANAALQQANSVSINFVNSIGGMQDMLNTLDAGLQPLPERLEGQYNFPYAGLSVHKYNGFQVSVKGTSNFIWHYESGRNENLFGRYSSAGAMEILAVGNPSTHENNGYTEDGWDWARIPGVTAAHLPLNEMTDGTARLFSARSFLANASFDNDGVFAMDYNDANSTTPMTGLKTVLFFKDKMLCMGSDFRNPGGPFALQTTLFQTALADINVPISVNGNNAAGIEYHYAQKAGGLWATDPVGNGYVVPANKANADSVVVLRSAQSSLNSSKKSTSGNFATTYLDHGVSPTGAKYVYGVALQAGKTGTKEFADHFDSYFKILQLDSFAHVAKYVPDNTFAYVVYNPLCTFKNDVVIRVDKPAVVMTRKDKTGKQLKISLTNPNLGIVSSTENFKFDELSTVVYRKPQTDVVTLIIAGHWQLASPMSNVNLTTDGKNTKITFATINGFTIQAELKPLAAL